MLTLTEWLLAARPLSAGIDEDGPTNELWSCKLAIRSELDWQMFPVTTRALWPPRFQETGQWRWTGRIYDQRYMLRGVNAK